MSTEAIESIRTHGSLRPMPVTLPVDSVLDYFRTAEPELVELLRALTAMDTPTGEAAGIATFADCYATAFTAAGIELERIPSAVGPHLFGERAGSATGGSASGGSATGASAGAVVLVGHSDTVWPLGECERRPPRLENGEPGGPRMYGPGVYDMKAGLCLIAGVMRCLKAIEIDLPRAVQVFISADEERGSIASKPAMRRALSRDSVALVTEPPVPGGDVKIRRKGVGQYWIEYRGREAHAGVEPEKGISAVSTLARRILALEALADRERGITINVGEISGGTAVNVVAGKARAAIDLRFDHTADGERLDAEIRRVAAECSPAELEIGGGLIFPPLECTERNGRVLQHAKEVGRALGLDLVGSSSGGGSDSSYLSSIGLGVLDGLGLDGAGAHAPDEHVLLDGIVERGALLTLLTISLANASEL